MRKFLHAADLHLDSPMRSLDVHGDGVAERLRNASREALRRLIDCALSHKVAFMVIAGDMFDVAQPSVGSMLHLVDELRRLTTRGIRVFIVRGNHDYHARRSARLWPSGVHEFSADEAESCTLEDVRVVVHGRSYREARVTEDLTPGYPAPTHGYLNVGVLHTALRGHFGEHAEYAPVSPETLASKGYDYWALGHVHDFLDLDVNGTRVVYPGNLQGRHVREQGKKGAALVTFEDGAIVHVERALCDVVRWHDVRVTLAAGILQEQLAEAVRTVSVSVEEDKHDSVESAVRLRLSGLDVEGQRLPQRELRERVREALRAECGGQVLLEELRIEEVARAELPEALTLGVTRAKEHLLQAPLATGDFGTFAKGLWQKLGALDPALYKHLEERAGVRDAEGLRRRCIELGAQKLAVLLSEKV
jgi:exonuclease SbcD